LENELAHREQVMKSLAHNMEKLESSTAHVPSEIRDKMATVREEWQNISRAAERRDKAIRAVSSQSDQWVTSLNHFTAIKCWNSWLVKFSRYLGDGSRLTWIVGG